MEYCWIILLAFVLGWCLRTGFDWLRLPVAIRRRISFPVRNLQAMAFTDHLTGLPNRFMLEQSAKAILRRSRPQKMIAAIFIDLDGFKEVNDTLGHAAGDTVLKECAKRFRARLRSTDLIARWGGDEFVVLLDGLDSLAEANVVAQALLATLETPISVNGKSIMIACSSGVSSCPGGDYDLGCLLHRADEKMYSCKKSRADKKPPASCTTMFNDFMNACTP